MGRVKRYKQIKACDPFAPKRGPGGEGATGGKRKKTEYDMPPEDSDSEGQTRKRRRQEKMWERDALRDEEYMEMLEAGAKRKKEKKLEIKPRMPNESLKAFKYRIRTETQAALRDSFVANSSTKSRRREYMKKRKKMKKMKKAGEVYNEEEEEKDAGDGGWGGRRGSQSSIGVTNNAPPDLRPFTKPSMKVVDKGRGSQAPAVAQRPRAGDSAREEALRAYRALKEARLSQTT